MAFSALTGEEMILVLTDDGVVLLAAYPDEVPYAGDSYGRLPQTPSIDRPGRY